MISLKSFLPYFYRLKLYEIIDVIKVEPKLKGLRIKKITEQNVADVMSFEKKTSIIHLKVGLQLMDTMVFSSTIITR